MEDQRFVVSVPSQLQVEVWAENEVGARLEAERFWNWLFGFASWILADQEQGACIDPPDSVAAFVWNEDREGIRVDAGTLVVPDSLASESVAAFLRGQG